MDSKTWAQIQNLLIQALEEPPQERLAFLKSACAGAPALFAEVAAMVEAHENDECLRIERRLVDVPRDGSIDDSNASLVFVIGDWRIRLKSNKPACIG
jgi:hypothetical protein